MRTLVLILLLGGAARPARPEIHVVTTTEDLAAIAREVGGDRVSVSSLAKGYQNPHYVDAKPSLIRRLTKADLFIQVGRELEVAWAPLLVQGSRNPRIQPGAVGFLDASAEVRILEKPSGALSRAEGDVHPLGNPHYWLDPDNGATIAATIRDALAAAAPAEAAYFAERTREFQDRLDRDIRRWRSRAEAIGLRGAPVVTYHRSWTYFTAAFGLEVVGFVEPKPGIPPSARHIHDLEHLMRERGVRLLLIEPYYDARLPEKIARETGARVVLLGPSVGSRDGLHTYFDLFERNLELLAEALREGSDAQP